MRGSSHETLVRCAGSSELEQPGETSTFDTDEVEVTLGRVEIFSLCSLNIHDTASLRGMVRVSVGSAQLETTFCPKVNKKWFCTL